MSEKQKKFLNELAELLDRYGIDNVNTAGNGEVQFHCAGTVLKFIRFAGGGYYGIETIQEEYTPTFRNEIHM